MTRRIDPPESPPRPAQAGHTRLMGASPAGSAVAGDPVAGWLVVVEGPGKGAALELGYGENPLGRAASMRLSLDFGADSDTAVTADRHAVVTYYPRERLFRVRHELGRNPTHLNGTPLLQPSEIRTGDTLEVGRTRLRFVALCGPDFDWTAGP